MSAIRPTPLERLLGITPDLVRYGLASAFSLLTILALSALLRELAGLPATVAVAFALGSAFFINFTLLRRFVFPGQQRPAGRQLLETAATSLSFRLLEYLLFLLLFLVLDLGYLLATTLAVCTSALGKFAIYREVVFKRERSASSSPPSTPGPASGADPPGS
jgi:putative flippase GtrA